MEVQSFLLFQLHKNIPMGNKATPCVISNQWSINLITLMSLYNVFK